MSEIYQSDRTGANIDGLLDWAETHSNTTHVSPTEFNELKDAVLSDYVRKEDIQEEVVVDLSQYTPLTGFYIVSGSSDSPTVSRSEFSTSSTFKTYDIPVSAGDTYRANSRNGSSGMAQIIFWDSNGDFVSLVNRGGSTTYNTTFTVPATAVLMSFCYTDSSSYPKVLYGYNNIADMVEEVQQDLATMQGQITSMQADVGATEASVASVVEVYASPNLFDKSAIISDKILSTSGGLTTVGSWAYNKCTGLIPVEPNKVYCISGCGISQGLNIRCLAADGTTKMKVLGAQSGTEYSTNYQMPSIDGTAAASSMNTQFKTPATAAYVQFNIATNADYTNTAMLELVGDAYDADFVPSNYEEYGSTTTVKQSALPESISAAGENADMALRRKFAVKVLLIGSSHGMNTISQFPWIAYKSGFTKIVVGNVYKGSLSLQQIAEAITGTTAIGGWFKVFEEGAWSTKNTTMFDSVITYTDWDYIILQRSAGEDETWTAEQSGYFSTIIERIKSVATGRPTILFNSGFSDPPASASNQMLSLSSHTRAIMNSVKLVRADYPIGILPSAVAVMNARQTTLASIGAWTYHNLCYDSQHLDYGIGCYVVGATLFHLIFSQYGFSIFATEGYGTYAEQKTFVGDLVDSGGESGGSNAYTEPTASTMKIARECAIAACANIDYYTPAEDRKNGVVFDVYNTDSSAPTDSGLTASSEGSMYYFQYNNTFMLKVGTNYYSSFPCYPNASDYTATLGVTYWCNNVAYSVQGSGKIGVGAMWRGTQAQYDALTTAQQQSIIAFIVEE